MYQFFFLQVAAIFALLLASVPSSSASNIALNFNNGIVLKDAVQNVNFTPSVELNAEFSQALNSAMKAPTAVVAEAYDSGNDLVVISNAWVLGDPATVNSQIGALDAIYAGWATTNSREVGANLNQVCIDNFRQQPTVIDVSDACQNTDPIDLINPNLCLRNFSVFFYTSTSVVDYNALNAALCRCLPTACSLIMFVRFNPLVTGIGAASTTFNLMEFNIYSADRELTLVSLLNFVQFASPLSAFQISYVLVDGVQVYYVGDPPVLTIESSDLAECTNRLWYLIFLIILVPIIAFVSQRYYYCGVASGKKTIKNTEADIRAGVHVTASPWAAFGYGGGLGNGYGGPGMGFRGQPGFGQWGPSVSGQWGSSASGQWGPSASGQWGQMGRSSNFQPQGSSYGGFPRPQQSGWQNPMASQSRSRWGGAPQGWGEQQGQDWGQEYQSPMQSQPQRQRQMPPQQQQYYGYN